jgi:large-conductance mechanosensitive channel
MRKHGKSFKKICAIMLAATILAGSLTGCGSSYNEAASDTADTAAYSGADYADEVYETDDAEVSDYSEASSSSGDYGLSNETASVNESAEDTTDTTTKVNQDSKKIIKKYNYDYETEEFDEAHAYLKQQIEAFNGYVSSSEIYGTGKRTLYLTARIPAEVSDQFVGQLGSLGTMVSQSESAEDITLQYTDTESRIASLKTEQERLLALLDKADTLENIITLEDRLTEVRYELENYESQRKVYDDLVTYSTVTITLEEVTYTVEVDDSTIFSRIKTGLEKSFRDIRNDLANFLVGFIVALPYLVIWAIIIFVIVWIIKKIIKRRKAKKAAKQEVQTQKGEDMQKEKE